MKSFNWKKFLALEFFIFSIAVLTQYLWTNVSISLDYVIIPIFSILCGFWLYLLGMIGWKITKRKIVFHLILGILSIIVITLLIIEINQNQDRGLFGNYLDILALLIYISSICTSYSLFSTIHKID